ncbi:MAG TPA: ATP-binding cassette domain-containing protein, partial [Burkholderiales bacterium]|nr:ATP-binding cassette domain-containing protein [Burkholderiales bacterium]
MLELSGINVHYGKNHVLRGIGLKIDAGEVVSLVGANAAGKTTTLRTIMGLKHPTSGNIAFSGRPVNGMATVERVRSGVVLVPEGRQVFPRFTVAENLVMGAYARSDRGRIGDDLDRVFGMFPRLAERRS